MSEPEKFLERWSRRKRETAEAPAAPEQEHLSDDQDASAPKSGDAQPAAAEPPVDLTSLPSIESIGPDTDVRGFLQAGVPPDLTRAALRRAWTSDPAIRDFVGLVENGWDFNDPNAVHGFGPISADEVERLLVQVIGPPAPVGPPPAETKVVDAQKELAPEPPPPPADQIASDGSQDEKTTLQCDDDVALQKDSKT